MFVIGILLMWLTFAFLAIGWAWIVGIAISEDDATAAVLCAVLPPFLLVYALVRLNKTAIPLILISLSLLNIALMGAIFGTP